MSCDQWTEQLERLEKSTEMLPSIQLTAGKDRA